MYCEHLIISNERIAGVVEGGALALYIDDPDIWARYMVGWMVTILSTSSDITYTDSYGWWEQEYIIEDQDIADDISKFLLVAIGPSLPEEGLFTCDLGQVKFSKYSPGV